MPFRRLIALFTIAGAASCGFTSTEPKVTHTRVDLDRATYRVGDTVWVRVTVINPTSVAAYQPTKCPLPIAQVYDAAGNAVWAMYVCASSGVSAITIPAGDSVSASYPYRAAAVGTFSVVGGLANLQGGPISVPSPTTYFEVTE